MPWHQLWLYRLTGLHAQLDLWASIWIGHLTTGRTRSWSLSPSRKTKIPLLPLYHPGSSRLRSYAMSSLIKWPLLWVKAHDFRVFPASMVFQLGVLLEQLISACHWKSYNTFTKFYLNYVVWADSKVFHWVWWWLPFRSTASPYIKATWYLAQQCLQVGRSCSEANNSTPFPFRRTSLSRTELMLLFPHLR